jgi:hypothetical protein
LLADLIGSVKGAPTDDKNLPSSLKIAATLQRRQDTANSNAIDES